MPRRRAGKRAADLCSADQAQHAHAGGATYTVLVGSAVANPAVERLSAVLAAWAPVLGPGTLPIAGDGGGNQFYLRATRATSGEPEVWLYLHDATVPVRRLAATFDAFIDGLQHDPDLI